MKKIMIFLLPAIFISFTSCENAKPVPKDKRSFIGLWTTHSGFQIKIDSSGIANVIPIIDTRNPDYHKLDVGITPEYAAKMFIEFNGDTAIALQRPQLIYRIFRVDRKPWIEGGTSKMIINGVVLTKH